MARIARKHPPDGSSAQPRSRGGGSTPKKWKGCRKFIACLSLLVTVAFAAYAAWLDLTVRARFEGATWALPARLYARPLELHPTQRLKAESLESELLAAGYHRVRKVTRQGSYSRDRGRYEIATRAFMFWDGAEPSRRLKLRIQGGAVVSLRESGQDVSVARLDPALIGRIYPGSLEDRLRVGLEDVPSVLVAGLLAVEDKLFFEHHGISLRGIGRAVWANLRAGRAVQGGSTLTQQLAKNLYLSPERTIWRKANEALIALILDLRYEKQAILTAYINEIYLGQEGRRAIHGFGLASWFYFGRRLDELNLAESALLIGMVRGASLYNPRKSPKLAMRRRALVLDAMADEGVVTKREAKVAKASPLNILSWVPKGRTAHPAFVDLVRAQLKRDYRDADLRSEGLQIFTTLEPLAQSRAARALKSRLSKLEQSRNLQPSSLQGAVVLVRPSNGEIVGLVGDRNPSVQGFNRAVKAVRPIGSLVKPAVFLTALERKGEYHLLSPLNDAPLTVTRRGQPPWSPQNYNRRYSGEISLGKALVYSNNVATVRLGLAVGVDAVVDTLHRLGVNRPVLEVPATLLGSVSLSPLEVAQVYQTLSNEGFRAPLRTISAVTDANGQPLARYPLAVSKVADGGIVYLIRHLLQRVVTEGTGRFVRKSIGVRQRFAGKTGTTDGLRDSWFAGFNHELLGVVWVGRDDNRPAKLTGSAGALRVWTDIVPPLVSRTTQELPPPAGVVWGWALPSGSAVTSPDCPSVASVPFLASTMPPFESCPVSGRDGAEQDVPGGNAG